MICYKKDFFKIMSRFNLMNIEQKVQKDLTTVYIERRTLM